VSWSRPLLLAALLGALVPAATARAAFDPAVEAKNYSKTQERATIYNTPEYQAKLTQISAQEQVAATALAASDPEREFMTDLCWEHGNGCAGDVRLYDWQAKGYGIVQPVLFTARNGATISGHVWATKAGPAKRPGVVITNGSVQADEQLYWFVAQALAKAGYVVLTWDPQGQGQSDTRGEGADADEGFPAQSDGRPFYDGTVDALDFFFSTPAKPYVPRKSCATGTSHAAKQDRRVKEGRNAAYNPFAALLDPSRVGVAGHSYGAAGVSYVGQWDARVKAIVAFDNLGPPEPGGGGRTGEQPCPADPTQRTAAPITKPALGLSGDYFLPPSPNTSEPDPNAKSTESKAYSQAGVDTGEIIIRGGTHLDFDWIPNQAFGATLRGADLIDWYTTAWFDRYVKGDETADARLRTDRWRSDAAEGAIDPDKDANMFSFYYPSRLDIGRSGGTRFTCEDLRPGCAGLTHDDGVPGTYDFFKLATTPDGPATASTVPGATKGLGAQVCTTKKRITLRAPKGVIRFTRTLAYFGKRRLASSRSRSVSFSPFGLGRGIVRVTLRSTGHKRSHGRTRTVHRRYTRRIRSCKAA
jgi:dienelactone hydrolase